VHVNAQRELCSHVSYTLKILVDGEIVDEVSASTLNATGTQTLEYTLQPGDRDQPREQCPCQKTEEGGPIDTRTGQSWTTATDLMVPGPGPALVWDRAYVTRNTALISNTVAPLGVGWQHAYGERIFTDPAEPNVVSILTPKGNRFRYLGQGNGTFKSFPGIFNTLVQANGVYTQTFRSHEQRVFDVTSGQLTDIYDADGGHLQLTYTDGKLTQIADLFATHRHLDLTYTDDRITAVQDGVGRMVAYTYITATNDLHQVFDVVGRPTTYLYQNHLLTGIDNALGQPIERTAYDAYTPAGKAISQTLLDGRQLNLSYSGSTTVVTTTAPTGEQDVETFVFGPQSTLTQRFVNGILVQHEATDQHFAPATRTDARGNQAQTTYNAKGQPLVIQNAAGQQTTFQYDVRSNPITITDTLGRKTVYVYNLNNQVTRQTTNIAPSLPLGITTIYTYSTQFPAQRSAEQLPSGLVNTYGLDATGQVITTTLGVNTATPQVTVLAYDPTIRGRVLRQTTGYGTSDASTTQLGYDLLGRVVTTTLDLNTVVQRQDVTRYTLDDSVRETILNYQNGVYDPAAPDTDLSTRYGYDALGRQVWVRDALGHYAVIHYDLVGRIDWTLQNLWPVTLNGQGEPPRPPAIVAPVLIPMWRPLLAMMALAGPPWSRRPAF
jgi:YD repeat-containing protein